MTILEIATILAARAGKPVPENGEDFAALNLPMWGGCQACGATIAAYNAHPQHNGFLSCDDCSHEPIVNMAEWEEVTAPEERCEVCSEPGCPSPIPHPAWEE